MADFEVTLPLVPGPGSPAKVVVDGVDLSDVVGWIRLDVEANQPNKLYLGTIGKGTITGAGIVQAVRDLDHRQVVVEFLDGLDAEELEREMSEEVGGFGDARTPAEIALDVLRRHVDAGR